MLAPVPRNRLQSCQPAVLLLSLWWLTSLGHAAATAGAVQHGTLLLSSVQLLDQPVCLADNAQPSTPSPAAAAQLCCLTVKAYVSALQLRNKGSAAAAQQQGLNSFSSTAPAAAFSLCRNTTGLEPGCHAALLQDSSGSGPGRFEAALLLPAAGLLAQTAQASAAAAASAAVGTSNSAGDSTPASSSDLQSTVPSTEQPTAAMDMVHQSHTPAVPATHSSKHGAKGLLLTVHATQELAGHSYLAISTQFLPAGTGVARLSINMSQFAHTWSSPDVTSSSHNSSSVSEESLHAPAPAPAAEQEPAAALQDAEQHSSSVADTPATQVLHAPTASAQLDLGTRPAAVSDLLRLLHAPTDSDPSVLGPYLPHMLGLSPSVGSMDSEQHSQLNQQQLSPQYACSSTSAVTELCSCPAWIASPAGPSAAEAASKMLQQLQAATHSCPYDASLSAHYQAAAAAAAAGVSVPAAPVQLHQLLQLAAVGTWTPREVLLGSVAAVLLLLLLLSRTTRASHSQHSPTALAGVQDTQQVQPDEQQQQHQQGRHSSQSVPRSATAAQDAHPSQLQDQYQDLDDLLEEHDADPFGYGPAPAFPTKTAAAVGQPGSMLAAAQAVKRASVMAAGEAAGALKDAFMRRHASQHAAAAAPVGSSAGLHTLAAAPVGASAGLLNTTAAAATGAGSDGRDWLVEEDEERVNQAPESIQRQLQAGGRWKRDGEGRLVRGSWGAVRNSLAAAVAAAQAVVAAVGSGGAARAPAAAAAEAAEAGSEGVEGRVKEEHDAVVLQQLLSAAPGDVMTFSS